MVRSVPLWPGGARNEAQMVVGPAETVRADGMRSPTDTLVVQLEARVRDLYVATFCIVATG